MIRYVPAPADCGLNTPPLTCVPEYVPPAGDPPLNVIGEELIQAGANAASVTVGVGLTVIVEVAVFVQPLPFVYEYVIVCVPAPAFAALNFPELTPVPEYVPPAGEPPVNVSNDAL